jgi:hypothetical protein
MNRRVVIESYFLFIFLLLYSFFQGVMSVSFHVHVISENLRGYIKKFLT